MQQLELFKNLPSRNRAASAPRPCHFKAAASKRLDPPRGNATGATTIARGTYSGTRRRKATDKRQCSLQFKPGPDRPAYAHTAVQPATVRYPDPVALRPRGRTPAPDGFNVRADRYYTVAVENECHYCGRRFAATGILVPAGTIVTGYDTLTRPHGQNYHRLDDAAAICFVERVADEDRHAVLRDVPLWRFDVDTTRGGMQHDRYWMSHCPHCQRSLRDDWLYGSYGHKIWTPDGSEPAVLSVLRINHRLWLRGEIATGHPALQRLVSRGDAGFVIRAR